MTWRNSVKVSYRKDQSPPKRYFPQSFCSAASVEKGQSRQPECLIQVLLATEVTRGGQDAVAGPAA